MTDRDLLQRAVSPSSPRERELALRAIYDRYSADVLGLCGWWLSDPDAAMDAAQGTFETAVRDLTGAGPSGQPTLREPDKLGAWLHGIAKNQCRAEWKRRNREGEFPGEDLEDAEHEVTASRRRQAQVDRMLDTVAESFTDRQQLIFQLVLRQGLRGQGLAAALGVSEKDANDATYENQALVADGFGAYVLALHGRAYCPGLARILDQAVWNGQAFTRVLRLRILRHLDNCKICDDCGTCNVQKRKLIAPYAPVIVPLLIAAELRDRIYQLIHRICTPPGPGASGQTPPATLTGLVVTASPAAQKQAIRHARHGRRPHRRRTARFHGPLMVVAVAALVATGLIVGVTLSGSQRPGSRASATAPAAVPPTALGAAVPVRTCGGRLRAPETVRLPAGVTLPAGAAVFDTGVAGPPGSSAGRYLIGPVSQPCTVLPGGNGTNVLAVGAADSPPRVFTMLMSAVTVPSCSASSGNLFAAMLATASRAQTCRSAVPGQPDDGLAGAVKSVLLHRIPGLSAVVAWAPHTQTSNFFAPPGGNLPTFAVFAARTAAGRKSAYAPEGLSCTLPPGQVLICAAALRYFLIQAAGPDTPPAALRAALNALRRFVTAHSAVG